MSDDARRRQLCSSELCAHELYQETPDVGRPSHNDKIAIFDGDVNLQGKGGRGTDVALALEPAMG